MTVIVPAPPVCRLRGDPDDPVLWIIVLPKTLIFPEDEVILLTKLSCPSARILIFPDPLEI